MSLNAFRLEGGGRPFRPRNEPVTGYVHSVETGGTVDGPGWRFVVFTAGCPLRCLYCHNPDICVKTSGTKREVSQVLEEIAGYQSFLKRTGGGVTISGGEPLAQPEFVTALLEGCKALGLHTALDTSGYSVIPVGQRLLDATDLVLLDLKSHDPFIFRRVTGVSHLPSFEFAKRLSDMGKPMWIRFVLVPELTDARRNVGNLADFVATLNGVERVEVLPFHKMGEEKWDSIGRKYELHETPEPTPEEAEAVRAIFRSRGLTVY